MPAYVCPPDKTVVVRQMSIAIGANIVPGSAQIRGPSGGIWFTFGPSVPTTGFTDGQRSGRWVIDAGDEIFIETSGGWIADFYISGFVLNAP